MNHNYLFFEKNYIGKDNQHHSEQYLKLSALAQTIIKEAQYFQSEIEIAESQKQLASIIRNLLLLMEQINKQHSEDEDKKEQIIKELQIAALSLPDKYHHRSNFSSLCYSVAKACVFLMALSVAFTIGYVFFAWYFAILSSEIFLDYLVYSLASIGIPSLSMGTFSFGLGNYFAEDSHKIVDFKEHLFELGELAVEYCEEKEQNSLREVVSL